MHVPPSAVVAYGGDEDLRPKARVAVRGWRVRVAVRVRMAAWVRVGKLVVGDS